MILPALAFYISHLLALHSIVLGVWTGMAYPPGHDGETIAWAIAESITEAPEDAVWGPEKTAAAMAYYSAAESGNTINIVSNWEHLAYGIWQQYGAAGKGDAVTQARGWLRLLKLGSETCSVSPAAPLSGGCTRARHLADRRTHTAWRLVNLEF